MRLAFSTNESSIRSVMESLEFNIATPGPCDEYPQSGRCAAELRACDAFTMFVIGVSAKRWRTAPKCNSTSLSVTVSLCRVAGGVLPQ
jgi:hypothetical protein